MVQTANDAGCIALKGAFTKDRAAGCSERGEGNGRKTELVFAQPDGKREGRVDTRYVKASGKQFYQKSDGREKEYRGDRHS